MKFFKQAFIFFAVVFFLAPSVSAQTFDVAGVKLGMTPHQAEKALHAKGYKPLDTWTNAGIKGLSHRKLQPSFEQYILVNNEEFIPPSKYKGLRHLTFSKNKEKIVIDFLEYPSGAFVNEVRYNLTVKTVSGEDFKARAIAKYGEPSPQTRNLSGSTFWLGDQNLIRDNISTNEKLSLGTRSLKLMGQLERGAYKKAVQDASPKESTETTF